MYRQYVRSQRTSKQPKDDSSTTRRQMTSQAREANRMQKSELPPIVRESEEIRDVPSESESKLLKRAKLILRFFNVDAAQWNKRKLIKWMLWQTAVFIMVVGLGMYTVITTWPIILEYAESPTSYIPNTLFNESIAIPSLVIALPLSANELDDYWKGSGNLPSPKNSTHYQKLLTAYFDNKTITKKTLLAKEYQWPSHLLFVGYYYLWFFFNFENPKVNLNGARDDINVLKNSDSDAATAINILDERMIRLNISMTEFQKKYSEMVKPLFNLTFIKNNRENSTMLNVEADYCWTRSSIAILFYFKHFEQHPIKDGEAITIQATRMKLPNPLSDYFDQASMYIFIGGRPYYELYDVQDYSKFDSSIKVIPLQVASTYSMLPYYNGKQQCYENKSIDSCISECQMEYYRTKCDCFPAFRHTDLHFNGSECYLKHYKSCFNAENMFNVDDKAYNNLTNCEESCLDICNRTKYFHPWLSWYSYRKDDEMFKAKYSIIELTIAKFDYPIFEEKLKWTFPSFIGVLGGSLGLWLGINVLDYIIYAATGIQFFTRRCKRKANNKSDRKSMSRIKRNNVRRRVWEDDNASSIWKRKVTATKNFFAFCIKIWTWKKLKKFTEIFLRIILGLLSLMITLLALKEYFNKKTEQILNVKYNDSIVLPNTTICLPLEFGELDSFSKSHVEGPHYPFRLAKYLGMQDLEKETFLPEECCWDNDVRNVVHAYLIEISNCEAGDYSKCNQIFVNDRNLVSAMNVLEIIISRMNISIDELRQKFGKEVAASYSFAVSLDDFGTWVKDININQTKYIDYDRICYEMPFNLYPLRITNRFEIWLSEYYLPSPKWFGWEGRGKITFDFENRLFMMESIRKYTFQASFGERVGLPVEISEYQSLREGNDEEVHCSELTVDQCETVGYIKFIQKQCNCTPTSWPSLLKYSNNV